MPEMVFVIRSDFPNVSIAADGGFGPELDCVAIERWLLWDEPYFIHVELA